MVGIFRIVKYTAPPTTNIQVMTNNLIQVMTHQVMVPPGGTAGPQSDGSTISDPDADQPSGTNTGSEQTYTPYTPGECGVDSSCQDSEGSGGSNEDNQDFTGRSWRLPNRVAAAAGGAKGDSVDVVPLTTDKDTGGVMIASCVSGLGSCANDEATLADDGFPTNPLTEGYVEGEGFVDSAGDEVGPNGVVQWAGDSSDGSGEGDSTDTIDETGPVDTGDAGGGDDGSSLVVANHFTGYHIPVARNLLMTNHLIGAYRIPVARNLLMTMTMMKDAMARWVWTR